MRDVIQIATQSLTERRIAAPSMDLGPAGHARLNEMSLRVIGDLSTELLDEDAPFGTRPNETHVAPQDVKQLRKLVEAPTPHESAKPRRSAIVGRRPDRPGTVFRPHGHATKL